MALQICKKPDFPQKTAESEAVAVDPKLPMVVKTHFLMEVSHALS